MHGALPTVTPVTVPTRVPGPRAVWVGNAIAFGAVRGELVQRPMVFRSTVNLNDALRANLPDGTRASLCANLAGAVAGANPAVGCGGCGGRAELSAYAMPERALPTKEHPNRGSPLTVILVCGEAGCRASVLDRVDQYTS